ncbi:phosphodiester glycosidase family protein [Patescibacteria group bacterium]
MMKLPKINKKLKLKAKKVFGWVAIFGIFFLIPLIVPSLIVLWQEKQDLVSHVNQSESEKVNLKKQSILMNQELEALKSEDQRVRNNLLEEEIENIQETYQQSVKTYENLLSLKEKTDKTEKFDDQYSEALSLLSKRNYASASAIFVSLGKAIDKEQASLAAKFEIPANVPEQNAPPSSGYRRQKVRTDLGTFLVSIVTADLNSARVVVDTAAESDCHNDCPVESLSTFASRNGAFAGINGSYFCPASYPSCADKKNSFDTLLMNKNKVYFNSDNNVYSTVPVAAFYGNTARFMAQSLEWGRDTGVDAVIANRPLLVHNGNIVFTGGGQPKEGARGGRSFIGATGSTVYIGVVHSATVAESAKALHTLGIQNAINLDNGGSTALWSGGYKVGPGRNLANAVLLVRK